MHKNPFDHRTYRHLTLDNGLKVLVVEDPKATRAAAAVAVNAGHFCDPRERQGLAHFVEHLLFMGTETHPGSGEYQQFIQRHGGQHNAWTGTEFTSYFLEVAPHQFAEALYRFSRFFVCPLFSPQAVDKERHAIDAEYRLKLQDDTRRLYQVHKSVVNPDHPFSQFSVGSLETLAGEPERLAAEARAFFDTYYVAKGMTLVLYGPQSIGELGAWARQYFTGVSDAARAPIPGADIPLYRDGQLPMLVQARPFKESRRLVAAFSLPSAKRHYRTKPLTFISHLLGHEGPDSLLSRLRRQGWVEELSAGGGVSGAHFREFSVQFLLTEEGEDHIPDILEQLLAYLQLIRDQGVERWRYEERSHMAEQAFRHLEVTQPMEFSSHLAVNLHSYAPDDALYGDFVMAEFKEQQIRHWLELMRLDNLRVGHVSDRATCDREAPWYDTPFGCGPLPQEWRARLAQPQGWPDLSLPKANPFMGQPPACHAVLSGKANPSLLVDTPSLRLWHHQDGDFVMPKGEIFLAMESTLATASPRAIALTRLWLDMSADSLTPLLYDAELAGLHWNLYPQQAGFTLQLGGLIGHQEVLLDTLLDTLFQQFPSRERFDRCRQDLIRQYRNTRQQKPIQQLFGELTRLMQPAHPGYPRLARELETIGYDELLAHREVFKNTLYIESLMHGNWPEQEGHRLSQRLTSLASASEPSRQVLRLGGLGSRLRLCDVEHGDSALVVYYQGSSTAPSQFAAFMLTNQLMAATFFEELRNKQQLGYLVGTGLIPMHRFPGLAFYIQSPVASPLQIRDAIDDFIEEFSYMVIGLSESQWQAAKGALIHKLSEPDASLHDKATRLWQAIGHGDTRFDRRQRLIQAIRAMTRASLLKFMKKHLKPGTANRLLLASHGEQHRNLELLADYPLITDIHAFKAHSPQYRWKAAG
ncbi:insulinase family protein [Gallaecimonas sp. GXIMD4217]|uniref:insulinase family protein n=1 Tax=Gallaecimonas sp. GXIMD4217 TaxID=3131927 RepID=UPI00311AE935